MKEETLLYLNEALEDDDQRSFLAALGDIATERSISQISENAGIPVDELNAIFSGRSDPLFVDILNIAKAVGLKIHFTGA